MKGENQTSVKFSDLNLEFWDKGNLNLTLFDKTKQYSLSRNNFQEHIVNYFKLNNDSYIELIKLIIKMENEKNGTK